MTSHTSSVILNAFGRIGTSSGVRRAIPSWQPPTPTPARSAASWATSLSQRKPKSVARQAPRQFAGRAKRLAVAVEADDAMMRKVGERARLAEAGAIVAVGVEADAGSSRCGVQQSALGRTNHAHRDVGVAARQILVAVGDGELDRDARMPERKAGEDREAALRIRRSRSPLRERRPRSTAASEDAERESAAAAAAIASPWGASASAAGVGVRPRGERVNSVRPSASSSASMCRPTVGWVSPSVRAAPDRLPSRTTSKKVRNSSQPGSRLPIQKCIAAQEHYAIPNDELTAPYVLECGDGRSRAHRAGASHEGELQ